MSLQGFNTAESGRKERIVEFSDDVSGARGVGGVGALWQGLLMLVLTLFFITSVIFQNNEFQYRVAADVLY